MELRTIFEQLKGAPGCSGVTISMDIFPENLGFQHWTFHISSTSWQLNEVKFRTCKMKSIWPQREKYSTISSQNIWKYIGEAFQWLKKLMNYILSILVLSSVCPYKINCISNPLPDPACDTHPKLWSKNYQSTAVGLQIFHTRHSNASERHCGGCSLHRPSAVMQSDT